MSEELRSKILLLLDARHRSDPSLTVGDAEIADALGTEIGEIRRQLDILAEQGLTREANTGGGHNAWISPQGIVAAERLLAPEVRRKSTAQPGAKLSSADAPTLKLFISHSAKDQATAGSLVDLMRSALALIASDIRCTSVDGYRLPIGADTDETLRREIHDAAAFIGILSGASISSAYVLFELGARWGAGLHLSPLLAPGAPTDLLAGPLAHLNALRSDEENQLHQLVGDIGSILHVTPQPVGAYRPALLRLVNAASEDLDLAKVPPAAGTLVLTPHQEAFVKGIAIRDADYVYVSELASELRWKMLATKAIADELERLDLLAVSVDAVGVEYGLSPKGRSLALTHLLQSPAALPPSRRCKSLKSHETEPLALSNLVPN